MAPAPDAEHRYLAGQSRLVAVVMVATVALWLGVQWLGGRMDWPVRFVFLADLAAMAAFIWALAVTWRIRRRMKSARSGS